MVYFKHFLLNFKDIYEPKKSQEIQFNLFRNVLVLRNRTTFEIDSKYLESRYGVKSLNENFEIIYNGIPTSNWEVVYKLEKLYLRSRIYNIVYAVQTDKGNIFPIHAFLASGISSYKNRAINTLLNTKPFDDNVLPDPDQNEKNIIIEPPSPKSPKKSPELIIKNPIEEIPIEELKLDNPFETIEPKIFYFYDPDGKLQGRDYYDNETIKDVAKPPNFVTYWDSYGWDTVYPLTDTMDKLKNLENMPVVFDSSKNIIF